MSTQLALWEARIVELETRLAFQDHTLEELNGVIISQQQQLDRFAAELAQLKRQLRQLAGGAAGTQGGHGY